MGDPSRYVKINHQFQHGEQGNRIGSKQSDSKEVGGKRERERERGRGWGGGEGGVSRVIRSERG